MNELSLPPGDRAETPDPAPAKLLPPFDPVLCDALRKHLIDTGTGQRDAATDIGVSVSAINKYINKKPEGDVAALESLVADYLKSSAERIRIKIELFQTKISEKMAAIFENVRKTGGTPGQTSVGIVTGPAGLGKTCGNKLYAANHPTSVLITALKFRGNVRAQVWLLWDQVDTRKWKKAGLTRSDYLARKFKGSGRLIIIDNCHRLTVGAIEWWFDFADETGCPLVFTGNPMFLDTLERVKDNDQQLSRTGIFHDLKMADAPKIADKMLDAFAPMHKEKLRGMAANVVAHRGHARALRMQLSLTRELMAGGIEDAGTAFRAAHTQLLNRNYPLEAA